MTQCDTTMVLEVKKPLQSGEWHSDKQIPTVGSGGVETESVIEAKPKAFKALNTSLSHKRVLKQFNLFLYLPYWNLITIFHHYQQSSSINHERGLREIYVTW